MTAREKNVFLGFARFFYAVAAGGALISVVSTDGFFRSSPLFVVFVIAGVGIALEWTVRRAPTVERDVESSVRPREPWLPPEDEVDAIETSGRQGTGRAP